jgi:hypothetical protein
MMDEELRQVLNSDAVSPGLVFKVPDCCDSNPNPFKVSVSRTCCAGIFAYLNDEISGAL